MNKDHWIRMINNLEPPLRNKYDKGGRMILKCLNHYNVNGLNELTEEQLKEFYKKEIGY